MYLPGTIGQRIGDLRDGKGFSQKELSDIIGIAASQLSRIENGQTKHISSDILINLSKALNVSTDYILGLTTVSVKKSYDISELRLSEGAVKTLVTNPADIPILNRLLEHQKFPYMLKVIKAYFEDTIAAGIATRNEMIDMATAMLGDFAKMNPDSKGEIASNTRLMKSHKMGEHEAEIEKIKSTFMAILRDIKKDMETGKVQGDVATAEFFELFRVQLAENPKQLPTADDIAAMTAGAVGLSPVFDEKGKKMFEDLAKHIFANAAEREG